jgi:hypothetical protein
MDLAEFTQRYRSLAVVACEWRAFELVDPEEMADAVFAQLERKPLTLKQLYLAIHKVVDAAYRHASGDKSILDVFRTPLAGPKKSERTLVDVGREAMSQLRMKELDVLQGVHWDELSIEELEELHGADAAVLLVRASDKFRDRLAKRLAKYPELGGVEDPIAFFKSLKAGSHRR